MLQLRGSRCTSAEVPHTSAAAVAAAFKAKTNIRSVAAAAALWHLLSDRRRKAVRHL